MKKHLSIRLSVEDHRLVVVAAWASGMTVQEFVRQAVLREARRVSANNRGADGLDAILLMCEGARQGHPGYEEVGRAFAANLRKCLQGPGSSAKLRELREHLATLDPEESRRDYAPLLRWCDKHVPSLKARIPPRRRKLFARGFGAAVYEREK